MPEGRHQRTARNIDAILDMERETHRELGLLQRIFHGVGWFVSTVWFAIFQTLALLIWIGLNVGPAHVRVPFDPYPFPLLSAVLALEAMLLTSFVLVRQSNLDEQSDRRNHIDLQINMLAEEEASRALKLLQAIAVKLGVDEDVGIDHEETSIDKIAKHLKAKEIDQ